jgi:hypothetical protein
MQQSDDLLETILVSVDVQAALCRQFLTLLRDERDQIRFDGQRNLGHRLIRGHFHVEFGPDQFAEQPKIAILDVTAILAQVHDDAVRAGQLDQERRGQRIRIVSAACLPQRGDVIDIHTESGHK